MSSTFFIRSGHRSCKISALEENLSSKHNQSDARNKPPLESNHPFRAQAPNKPVSVLGIHQIFHPTKQPTALGSPNTRHLF